MRTTTRRRLTAGITAALALGIAVGTSSTANAADPVVLNANPNTQFIVNTLGATNFTGGSASCTQTDASGDFGVLRTGFEIVPNVPAGGSIKVVISDKLATDRVYRTDTILPGDSKQVTYTQAADGLSQFDPVRFDVFSFSATGVKKNLGVASTSAYCGWADQSRVLSDIMTVLGEGRDENGRTIVRTFTKGDNVPMPALQNLTGFTDKGRVKITWGHYTSTGSYLDKGVLSEYAVTVLPSNQTWFKSPVAIPYGVRGNITVEYTSEGYAAEPFTTSFDTRIKTSSGDDD